MRLTAPWTISFLLPFMGSVVQSFTSHSPVIGWRCSTSTVRFPGPVIVEPVFSATSPAVTGSSDGGDKSTLSAKEQKKKDRMALIRKEGGPLSFNTKYGALNPFGIYYGLMAILLGIPWLFGLLGCQLLYFVTGNRVDKFKRIPIFISHVWGVSLLRLTRNYPKIDNKDILKNFYKEKRPAMFVANHASWMDIPFLGALIGWRNYKLVSKKELGNVPILGKAIKVGGHVMLDRSDRRSQMRTLKRGIQCLKDGIILCTFPEGTRSRSGKLAKFKNGAFKMAFKAGAPVIPISIANADKVMPSYWMFPYKPARNVASVIIHEPVETNDGKNEQEVAEEVRKAMISGLPEDQRPASGE